MIKILAFLCMLLVISNAFSPSTYLSPTQSALFPTTNWHFTRPRSSSAVLRPAHQLIEPPRSEAHELSPWENWWFMHMQGWYRKALAIKCPFFRRRASDLLDAADQVSRFIVIRHKSLDIMGPPLAYKCEGDICDKQMNLPIEDIVNIIRKDWRVATNKGYYITGKLNTSIYRDDCLFIGPDPDMPVKGLRKYLNAASQLFEQSKSRCELLSLNVEGDVIVATWRMNGVLRLPWKPKLPNWTGSTIYHLDVNGLVYKHEEEWDMSVFQAFMRTFWPDAAIKIFEDN